MVKIFFLSLVLFVRTSLLSHAQQIIAPISSKNTYPLITENITTVIYADNNEPALVKKTATLLQQDIEAVTGKKLSIIHELNKPYANIILIGTIGQSSLLKELAAKKKINTNSLKNKWEAYTIQNIRYPFSHVNNILVIAGNDRRGVAFGVFELSRQMGVSPWYWWADVPVKQQEAIYINSKTSITDSPKVKYRGIFINDEAPALSGWSKEKFGGFNHLFYEKVFELMLRLKSNYLWPAMWGNAFYDDDSLNIKSADEYGIVIGTSHHEPLMRAHEEWKKYGNKQKWNYDSTEAGLKEFWRKGMQRATNEKIVSIGMRGDGDEPMSRETATSLLERIVKDQRQIIEEVTGKPANQTPQLWALYKEVQDYYDKGMRVPDDVTLLLCDDNWGNIRKLPKLNDKPRMGGYGIYYHFDYVGGPRNYKWVNTNPIPRVWEQMHLAYEYKAREIWIVNVGDIKPMEFPISFFLDYAWNPDKIQANDLQHYTESWAAAQFGSKHAVAIADIISKYSKYNGRRKPELLDANTYSIENYNEAYKVVDDFKNLLNKAEQVRADLPTQFQDAFFQLVLHPVKACANLNEMYYNLAMNKKIFDEKRSGFVKDYAARSVKDYADRVKELYKVDSLTTIEYHQLAKGKWNHMMDQTHIGYTYWQQPTKNSIPYVYYMPNEDSVAYDYDKTFLSNRSAKDSIPKEAKGNIFYEYNKFVSLEASHFSKAINTNQISWIVLQDLGKTGDAITSFPVTAPEQMIGESTPRLEYVFYSYSKNSFRLQAYFSPTLNFHNDGGLKYAISIDNEPPQIININSDESNVKTWEGWVANNIIIKTSGHKILEPGKHVIKYWMVSSGVVLQKLVVDFGGVKPSYLGPPETKN